MTLPRHRHHPLTAGALALGLGLGLAGAVQAQDDPIAALLDKAAPPAAAAPSSPPAAPPSAQPAPAALPPVAAPPPASPPASQTPAPAASRFPPPEAPRSAAIPPPAAAATGRPTRIEETGRSPDGPPTPTDLYFESRVRQSFAAAQGLQGPLDGRWVVRAGPTEVYDLQLVDKNQGTIEGAWRDPRRRGATDASGFIESIQRTGGELTIWFRIHAGDNPVQLALRQAGDAWTGDLVERGERRPVTVRRN